MTEARPSRLDAHLVVKRGHRGRFRFVLISGDERIGGEVRIDDADPADDVDARTVALARIARLAGALLDGLGRASRIAPDCTQTGKSARLSNAHREVEMDAGG